jgi:hypothetical protein
MSRETNTTTRRKSHLAWLAAGALGLAVVGAGAVQAQRFNDDGPGYGDSRDGWNHSRQDGDYDRYDRSDRRYDRSEGRYDRDSRRSERDGRRFDRAERESRGEHRERSGHRHWRMSHMERMRAYCARDTERYEPAIRLYIKADLRLNKDQETAFDQLADAVMPAIADVKKARCEGIDAVANMTPPERLQRRAGMLRKMADVAEKATEPLNKFYGSLDDAQKERVQRVVAWRVRSFAVVLFGPFAGHMGGQHGRGGWQRQDQGGRGGQLRDRSNDNAQPAEPRQDQNAQPDKL